MERILLTTVYKPFGVEDDEGLKRIVFDFSGKFGNEKVFNRSAVIPLSNLHLIANNIEADTTVLEFPTRKEFVTLISNNLFDYVGISFIPPTYKKALNMVKDVKEHSPSSKIVLGGYGTLIPEVKELEDVIVCHGDGIEFIRNLLNRGELRGRIKHPILHEQYYFMGLPVYKLYPIVIDTGCDEGCEFCLTSHYWKNRRLNFLSTAEDIFDYVKKVSAYTNRRTNRFVLYSENATSDPERIEELADLVDSSDLNPRFDFQATAKGIHNIEIETLLRMGSELVYIGVESPSNLQKYDKTRGLDIKKVFDRLHHHGIITIGTSIFFSAHHNKMNLAEDIEFMQNLGCTRTQFSIYTPFLSTPAFRYHSKSDDIIEFDWRYYHAFHPVIRHPNFTPEEMNKIRADAEERFLRTPSVFRAGLTKLRGYKTIKTKFPNMKKTLETLEHELKRMSFLIPLGYRFADNREAVKMFERGMGEEFGLSPISRIVGEGVKYYGIAYNTIASKNDYYFQPKTLVTKYEH